ncbi:MAG: hypothetical protein ABI691_24240 [Ginsengibacter sp.]
MHYIPKSSLVLFFSIVMLSKALGQQIIYLKLDPATNELIDPGDRTVHPGESVSWQIDPTEHNIDWFRIECFGHPFSNTFPCNGRWIGEGGTVQARERRRDWKYKITYKPRHGDVDELDPKIAIRPPSDFTNLVWILLSGVITFLATSIFFFGKWRKAEVNLKNLRQIMSSNKPNSQV